MNLRRRSLLFCSLQSTLEAIATVVFTSKHLGGDRYCCVHFKAPWRRSLLLCSLQSTLEAIAIVVFTSK
ncbi:hypothetical protein, partial [Nostoc commune]|uniref:hypothetical protein n=1 Tax=Nostoc commune TaxID=1178 RepID=UPI0018C61B07